MTPLKQPIVVTIKHVENAVLLMIIGETKAVGERQENLSHGANPGEINKPLGEALMAQGIDYKTWEAPKPIVVGEHKVRALTDGSIKVGCTTVSRSTLEAILKLSSEAMEVWPKWWRCDWGHLYKAESDSDFGTTYNKEYAYRPSKSMARPAMVEYAKTAKLTPLTPAQAREILEAKG